MTQPLPQLLEYFLEDMLWGDSDYSYKRMFGGYGIYKNGQFFAIFWYNQLYFKVGENNLADYINHGSEQFTYERQGKTMKLSYYTLPESILHNKELLEKWIEKSLEIEK